MKKKKMPLLLLTVFVLVLNFASLPLTVAAQNIPANLTIDAVDGYYITPGIDFTISVNFSGLGIAGISLEVSGNGLIATIADSTWNAYPEICSATISASSSNDFTGGNISFHLIDDNNDIIKSHTIEISNLTPASNVYDLNIEAPSSYSLATGQSETIEVNFSGHGIARINMEVLGDGLSATFNNTSWKAYPEMCTTSIKATASDRCEGGTIVFQLIGDDSSVIKEQSIEVQTYTMPPANNNQTEPLNLKEIKLSTGYYIFHSKLDDTKVIDVSNISLDDKAYTQLWSNYMSNNQIWYISYAGDGYYYITAVHSKKRLDVAGGESHNGTYVWQYSKNDSDAQKWKFYSANDQYIYIQPKCAAFSFLDAQGGNSSNGTKLQIYEKNYTDAQKWRYEKVGKKATDLQPITYRGSFILDYEIDVSDIGISTAEGIQEDINNILLEGIDAFDILNDSNFLKFLESDMPCMFDAIDSIFEGLTNLPTFSGSIEIPQMVSIAMRKHSFNNLDGMKFVVEDGNSRTTYVAYIYPVIGNSYNFVMFKITEKKTWWKDWEIDNIEMIGGFSGTVN